MKIMWLGWNLNSQPLASVNEPMEENYTPWWKPANYPQAYHILIIYDLNKAPTQEGREIPRQCSELLGQRNWDISWILLLHFLISVPLRKNLAFSHSFQPQLMALAKKVSQHSKQLCQAALLWNMRGKCRSRHAVPYLSWNIFIIFVIHCNSFVTDP